MRIAALGNGYSVSVKRHSPRQWIVKVAGECVHAEPIRAITNGEAQRAAERIAMDHLTRMGVPFGSHVRWVDFAANGQTM